MTTVWVDTNVVLRFLTRAPLPLFERAAALMRRAADGEVLLHVTPVVVAEVAAVLHHSLGLALPEVADALRRFVTARGVEAEDEERVLQALERSGRLKVDFVDAYLCGLAMAAGAPIASFDADFPKRLGAEGYPL